MIPYSETNKPEELLTRHALTGPSALLPPNSGVYFLWKMDLLVYIGSSSNVTTRLKSHSNRGFTHYSCFLCEESVRLKTEKSLIARLHPPGNGNSCNKVGGIKGEGNGQMPVMIYLNSEQVAIAKRLANEGGFKDISRWVASIVRPHFTQPTK